MKEERSLVTKGESCLSLFYQDLSFSFFFNWARVKMFWSFLWLNKKRCWTSLGLNSVTWPRLFPSKTIRKHSKFISVHKDFIIRILSFVIFSSVIFSSAFFIRIFRSEFFHPPSVICHPVLGLQRVRPGKMAIAVTSNFLYRFSTFGEKRKETYRVEVWVFCKTLHRISFIWPLRSAVRQFQMPL